MQCDVLAGNTGDTDEKVAFLSKAGNYPEYPAGIEVIQTHMSWVFLTNRHAYKFKKPIRREFLNFSTLEDRLRNCREEVRLNLRLAPGVYLGVIALVRTGDGRLSLDAPGEVVEWLVKMRRLPRVRMLDQVIAVGGPGVREVRRFASILAGFYRDAARVDLDPPGWRRKYYTDLRSNCEALSDPSFKLERGLIDSIAARLAEFLDIHGGVLEDRVSSRRLVEGHGDLRPEHVCLEDPPVFIDCLEFNREFRIIDPVDELAYLSLECNILGAPHVGVVVFDVYQAVTMDRADSRLIEFYQGQRALLRAKLSIWHLLDREVSEHDVWIQRTNRYLEAADSLSRCL